MGNFKTYANDARLIKARFQSRCAETGKVIKKGDLCLYYPLTRQVFCGTSNAVTEWREMIADYSQGFTY